MEWTDTSVSTLRRMWLDGFSAGDIAPFVYKSRSAVCGKVARLDLPRRVTRATTRGRRLKKDPSRATGKRRGAKAKKAFAGSADPGMLAILKGHQAEADARADLMELVDIEIGQCRFPVGDPSMSRAVMCGRPGAPNLPYCEEHAMRCYPRMDLAKRMETPAEKEKELVRA